MDTRRSFLYKGALALTSCGMSVKAPRELLAAQEASTPSICFGLLTDCHYAAKAHVGSRYYRESLNKIDDAVRQFNDSKADFAVELGDFIDAADDVDTELGWLRKANEHFAKFTGARHYVLGNHCVATLSKKEFLNTSGAKKAYYSFDRGDIHFVILDACYRHDGVSYGRNNFDWTDANVPPHQIKWLRNDLKSTFLPVVVFVHQRLDGNGSYFVKNAMEVRSVLEDSGKVLAVFQGHSHKNSYKDIAKIHYCTLRAVVEESGIENSGHAVVSIFPDRSILVDGYRQQSDYDLKKTSR